MPEIHREYRDRLFCYIFGSEAHKDWTLSLYNAVNGSSYTDPSAITIATLTQVVYMGMHNDVAFLIADEINLYEQQSTYNPNMPLRGFFYFSQLYQIHIEKNKLNIHSSKLIKVPELRQRGAVLVNVLLGLLSIGFLLDKRPFTFIAVDDPVSGIDDVIAGLVRNIGHQVAQFLAHRFRLFQREVVQQIIPVHHG